MWLIIMTLKKKKKSQVYNFGFWLAMSGLKSPRTLYMARHKPLKHLSSVSHTHTGLV